VGEDAEEGAEELAGFVRLAEEGDRNGGTGFGEGKSWEGSSIFFGELGGEDERLRREACQQNEKGKRNKKRKKRTHIEYELQAS
jgi:hypothetical protein